MKTNIEQIYLSHIFLFLRNKLLSYLRSKEFELSKIIPVDEYYSQPINESEVTLLLCCKSKSNEGCSLILHFDQDYVSYSKVNNIIDLQKADKDGFSYFYFIKEKPTSSKNEYTYWIGSKKKLTPNISINSSAIMHNISYEGVYRVHDHFIPFPSGFTVNIITE